MLICKICWHHLTNFQFEVVKSVKDQTEVSANSRLSRNTWQRIKSKILQSILIWHWWFLPWKELKHARFALGGATGRCLGLNTENAEDIWVLCNQLVFTDPYRCISKIWTMNQNKTKRSRLGWGEAEWKDGNEHCLQMNTVTMVPNSLPGNKLCF